MYKNYFWLVFGFLTILCSSNLTGQNNNSAIQSAVKLKEIPEDFFIEKSENYGIILVYAYSASITEKLKTYYITGFDRNLNKTYNKTFPALKNTTYVTHHIYNDKLYILLAQKDQEQFYVNNYYQILEINLKNGEIYQHDGIFDNSYLISKILLINDNNIVMAATPATSIVKNCGQFFFNITLLSLCFNLNINNPSDCILSFDLKNNKLTKINLKTNKYAKILSLNNAIAGFSALLQTEASKKNIYTILSTYTNEKTNNDTLIFADKTINPLNGYIIPSGKSTLITGTYYHKKKNIKLQNQNAIYSNGILMYALYNTLHQYKLYPYQKFLYYSQNKHNAYNEETIFHTPIIENDGIILITEFCEKEYRDELYTSYSYGMPNTYSRRIFIGYRYSHALIAKFDFSGNMIWNNYIEYPNVLLNNKEKLVSLLPTTKSEYILAYSINNTIKYKVIEKDKTIQKTESIDLFRHKNTEIKSNLKSKLVYWYKDYYIGYAIQKTKQNKQKAELFLYMNKFAFK